MEEHNCENCPIRVKYDRNPKSLIGRFWQWHINFCSGWKSYIRSVDEDTRTTLKMKYRLK